jgi:twitching motility protein PilI
MTAIALRNLLDKPYELLLEIERRAQAAQAGHARDSQEGDEWVGVSFRLGAETFLLAREETREVLSVPNFLTRVPGAKHWIRGLANVRGQLLPVIDLRAFLGGASAPIGRSARILVINHRDIPAGFLVDEVHGFRRYKDREFSAQPPATLLNCTGYLAGVFRRGSEVAPVFGLRSLLESNEFLMGAAH